MKLLKKFILIITLIIALSSSVFCYEIYAADDTTALQAAHDATNLAITTQNASSVDDPYYEVNSYQTFTDKIDNLGGLAGIQAVIDDPSSEQTYVDNLTLDINEALNGLTLDDTYNLVSSELSLAEATDLVTYTTSSQVIYNTELDRIENILNTPDSGETVIQALSQEISNASNLLELIGDKTDLQAAYDLAITSDLTSYTPNSIVIFNTELNRINDIINSNDVNQTDVDTAITDLQAAYDLLVLIADKTNLEFLNQLLIKAYYEESQLYTKSSHDLFKSTCDGFGSYLYVNSVIIDDNATSNLVTSLETEIQTALDGLVPLSDNTELLSVYYLLYTEDISAYTDNSQTAYITELDRLYAIIISNELDEATAQQVLLDLPLVQDLLVELSDYSELQQLYDTKDIYREEDYSSSSYGILNIALINSEAMLNNFNATQQEIDETLDSLQNAIDGLQQTIETIYIQENESVDITEYVLLGDATIASYTISNEEIISVDNNGNVYGVSYGKTNITVVLSNGIEETIEVSVMARIATSVYILVLTMPVATIGLAILVIYTRKETWTNLSTKVRLLFKKK